MQIAHTCTLMRSLCECRTLTICIQTRKHLTHTCTHSLSYTHTYTPCEGCVNEPKRVSVFRWCDLFYLDFIAAFFPELSKNKRADSHKPPFSLKIKYNAWAPQYVVVQLRAHLTNTQASPQSGMMCSRAFYLSLIWKCISSFIYLSTSSTHVTSFSLMECNHFLEEKNVNT